VTLEKIEKELSLLLKQSNQNEVKAALVTNPQIRRLLTDLLERPSKGIQLLSFDEIEPFQTVSLGSISNEVLI
jgi:flagellar biosynthesis component FlhA